MRANIFIIGMITVTLLLLFFIFIPFYSRFESNEATNHLARFANSVTYNESDTYFNRKKIKEGLEYEHNCAQKSEKVLLDVTKIEFLSQEPEEIKNRINYIKKFSDSLWLRLTVPQSYIDEKRQDLLKTLIVLFFLVLIPLIMIVLLSMSRLFKPLRSLTRLCYDLQEHRPPTKIYKASYEIEELYDAIVSMYNKNQTLHKNNIDLIKEAAHELKAPIAIMQARVTLFEMDDNYNKKRFVEENYNDIALINNKLKELLLLKEIEWDVEQEPSTNVSVKDACEMIQVKFLPMLELRKLSIISTWEETFYVYTHHRAIEKVLVSIFENVFLHTKEGSSVYVRANINQKSLTIASQTRESENELHFSSHIGKKIITRFSKILHYRVQTKSSQGFYITKIIFTDL